ncbi:ead/Ea22-like family protein [Citrobacter braakii]|uniref:ead/Ea22-like family protein n=1 Tax=Citrobacter braakii TaxID=57706 RepID=UPI002B24A5DB|nr:ead/Ea22-like family protein [Citrobacter braakii]MEB0968289.1 ead/Ea22-like family protein [Citrobacter braakii]
MSEINYQALHDALGNLDIEQWCTKFNGDDYEVVVKGSIEKGYGYCCYIPIAQEVTDKNTAKFIAAASPATIKALLDELEADKEKIKTLESRNRRLEGIIDAAEKLIAELEAREVKLPKPISVLHRRDFNDAHRAIYAYPEAEVNAALAAAGIGVKGE